VQLVVASAADEDVVATAVAAGVRAAF